MVIYGHLCYAVGKRDNERDLGCIDTPEVSFYAGITHFPVFTAEVKKFNISTFPHLDFCSLAFFSFLSDRSLGVKEYEKTPDELPRGGHRESFYSHKS